MNVSQFQYRLLQSFRAIVRWVVACLRQKGRTKRKKRESWKQIESESGLSFEKKVKTKMKVKVDYKVSCKC